MHVCSGHNKSVLRGIQAVSSSTPVLIPSRVRHIAAEKSALPHRSRVPMTPLTAATANQPRNLALLRHLRRLRRHHVADNDDPGLDPLMDRAPAVRLGTSTVFITVISLGSCSMRCSYASLACLTMYPTAIGLRMAVTSSSSAVAT